MTFSSVGTIKPAVHARATHATQASHATQSAQRNRNATGIPVLPAVDINLGTVSFVTPHGHRTLWSSEPAQLVDALGQAVCPPRWIPELGTLVVTVAQTGVRTGRGLGFRLTRV